MLEDMVGSAKELDLHMTGASETVELRNVEKVEAVVLMDLLLLQYHQEVQLTM